MSTSLFFKGIMITATIAAGIVPAVAVRQS